MSDAFDDLLAGGVSIPSAVLGDKAGEAQTVKGLIVAKGVNDAKVFGTNEVKTWKDGTPIKQLVITIATDDRNPAIPDDDGRRRIYCEQDRRPGSKFYAVSEAIKDAGVEKMELGGILAVAFVDRDPDSKAAEKRKRYRAQYQPPAHAAADDLLAAPVAPVAQAAPAQPVAPAPLAPAPVGSLI